MVIQAKIASLIQHHAKRNSRMVQSKDLDLSPEDGSEVLFADCENIIGNNKELKESILVDYKVKKNA